MRLESYQLFAELCETFLPEASTSLDLIKSQSGGTQLVQKLHKDMGLSHNQDYRPIAKIAWSELKDHYSGAWVIIQGDKGVGAIKAERGSYTAIASDGNEAETFRNDRGGNILDFIKGKIGQLRKFYVGADTGYAKGKQRSRAELNKTPSVGQVNQDTLVKKFRPLWAKAITAAIADVKGHITNMIKNDAFDKAQRKLDYLNTLNNGLDAIETSDDVPDFVRNAVRTSILMAASHYYPEETGAITRGYRGSSYNSEREEGPRKLLADISAGDQKKLGAVLGFFKRSLISG